MVKSQQKPKCNEQMSLRDVRSFKYNLEGFFKFKKLTFLVKKNI